MGAHTTWELLIHGSSYYMGAHTIYMGALNTWELILHGSSYYMGAHTTWELASYPGPFEKSEKRARYPLFAHALN